MRLRGISLARCRIFGYKCPRKVQCDVMSERDEIQLRRLKSIWQTKQDTAGMVTLFLGFVAVGVCLFFVSAPGWQLAAVMVCLTVLLVVSCWRMIASAAKVVEIGKLLNPSRFRSQLKSEVIEAEVVDHGAHQFLLS